MVKSVLNYIRLWLKLDLSSFKHILNLTQLAEYFSSKIPPVNRVKPRLYMASRRKSTNI